MAFAATGAWTGAAWLEGDAYVQELDDDAAVLRRIEEGEVDAFAILVQRYQDLVGRIAGAHVPAEFVPEVAQEIFVNVFRALDRYDGRSPFRNYVATIARRRCAEYWRQTKRRHETPLSAMGEGAEQHVESVLATATEEGPAAAAHRREARELLDHVLAQLNAADRMLITLVYFEGCTFKDAAAALEISETNAKVRAHRARKRLRRLLQNLVEGSGK